MTTISHNSGVSLDVLAAMTADEQFDTLRNLDMATIAGAIVKGEGVARSGYRAVASNMTAKHGEGWAELKFGGRALTELEKQQRDNIKADREAFLNAMKAAGHSNQHQAWTYVINWATGKAGKPRGADTNKARPTMLYLKEEMPKLYRKLNNAEDMNDHAVALFDAIGEFLKLEGIDPRSVLGG
jgi:hypothetical protein